MKRSILFFVLLFSFSLPIAYAQDSQYKGTISNNIKSIGINIESSVPGFPAYVPAVVGNQESVGLYNSSFPSDGTVQVVVKSASDAGIYHKGETLCTFSLTLNGGKITGQNASSGVGTCMIVNPLPGYNGPTFMIARSPSG